VRAVGFKKCDRKFIVCRRNIIIIYHIFYFHICDNVCLCTVACVRAYYKRMERRTGCPQQSQYGHDSMENSVAAASDGTRVYGLSKVTVADNGDVIATVTNTDNSHAAYPFVK